MTNAYYNENDPYAAQWLRNLIAGGKIAAGDVDERSIKDVRADDLAGYQQCHFFAGIGVWSYALRSAGWPDDAEVWTGSCPCQPFSAAGRREGVDDPRHLWPEWHRLIAECAPSVVFGEQVAAPDGYAWLDLVHADMESSGYAFAPIVLPAAGFGAPHGRHRIYFVADADGAGPDERPSGGQQSLRHERRSSSGTVEHAAGQQEGVPGLARQRRATSGYWADADWIPCRGGKWRPIEPGAFPLAHGVASRMDKLRAYGNAIVAPQAIEFVSAYRNLFSGD